MKLITKELEKKIPKFHQGDGTCWAKLFYPDFDWTWYIMEMEGDECFGLVDGWEKELGYFSFQELRETKGKLGCSIERDLYFEPIKYEDLIKKI